MSTIPESAKNFAQRTILLAVAPIVTFLGSAFSCWQVCQWFTRNGFPLITAKTSIDDLTWNCAGLVVILIIVVAILAQIKNIYTLCGATLLAPVIVFSVILTFAAVYTELGLNDTGKNIVTKDRGDALYFSIITITTVGYGDFTPTTQARWYACDEALSGFALLGVIMATITTALFTHAAMRMKETVDDITKTFGSFAAAQANATVVKPDQQGK